jgi:hypothetical protein
MATKTDATKQELELLASMSAPMNGSARVDGDVLPCPICETGILLPRAGFQPAPEDTVIPIADGRYQHTLNLITRIIGLEYACNSCGAIPVTYQMDPLTAKACGTGLDAEIFMRSMFAK